MNDRSEIIEAKKQSIQLKKTGYIVFTIFKNTAMNFMAPFAIGCEGLAAVCYIGGNWRRADLPSLPRIMIKLAQPLSGIIPAVFVGPHRVLLNLFDIQHAFGDRLPTIPGFSVIEKTQQFIYKSSMSFLTSTREMSLLANEYNALMLDYHVINNPTIAYPVALVIASGLELGNRMSLDVVLPVFKQIKQLVRYGINLSAAGAVRNYIAPRRPRFDKDEQGKIGHLTLEEYRSLGDVFSDHWLSIISTSFFRALDGQKLFSAVSRAIILYQFNYSNTVFKWGGSAAVCGVCGSFGAIESMLFHQLSRQVTNRQEELINNEDNLPNEINLTEVVKQTKQEKQWSYFCWRSLSFIYLLLSAGTTTTMVWDAYLGLYTTEFNPEGNSYVPDPYGYGMIALVIILFSYNVLAYRQLYPLKKLDQEAKKEYQKAKKREEKRKSNGETIPDKFYSKPRDHYGNVLEFAGGYITLPEGSVPESSSYFSSGSSGSEDSPQKRRGSKESHTGTNHSQKIHDIDTDSGVGTEEDSLSLTTEKQLSQNPVALEEGPSRSGSDESLTSQLLESSAEEKNQSSPEIKSQLSHHWWKKLDVFGLLSSSEKRKNSNSASDDSSTYTPPSETPSSNNNEQQNDVIELQEVRRKRSHRSRHM